MSPNQSLLGFNITVKMIPQSYHPPLSVFCLEYFCTFHWIQYQIKNYYDIIAYSYLPTSSILGTWSLSFIDWTKSAVHIDLWVNVVLVHLSMCQCGKTKGVCKCWNRIKISLENLGWFPLNFRLVYEILLSLKMSVLIEFSQHLEELGTTQSPA